MKRIYKRLIAVLFLLVTVIANTFAQIDNSPFFRYQTINETDEGNLYFAVSHLSFNKDDEYFNQIADGFTLFGNQLTGSFIYYPFKNVRLEGGVYFRKDFGNKNYSEIAPVFSVKIKHKDFALIFGNLEGSLNHQLAEPLYDFEKIMTDRMENGIQILLNKKHIELDGWLNWEHMLYTGDSTQERLSGGLSSTIKIVNTPSFRLSVPLQFTAMHIGGQIDASPLPLTTKFNGCAGLKLEKDLGANFFKTLYIEPYALIYKDFSFEYQDAFKYGSGLYLNVAVKTKINTIMISYWQGDKYISTHGGLLYNSRSTSYKYAGYLEPQRKLLMLRLLTDIVFTKSFSITSRFEPFYDFTRKKFEFSMGLYINYNDRFKLLHVNKENIPVE